MPMNDSTPLHWSFNYNTGSQAPHFSEVLLTRFLGCSAETEDPEAAATHVYTVLPNYWRGYHPAQGAETFPIGTASVHRHRDAHGLWQYAVRYENRTSGEDLRFRFCCRDDTYRTLHADWQVEAANAAGDAYTRIVSEGRITGASELRLTLNGVAIDAGRVDAAVNLTCNWALFDVIPTLAGSLQSSGAAVTFALLEDLAHLRPESRLGFLEAIQVPAPLRGYYVHGVGLLPSYWWLHENGDIGIVSTFFETWVLTEKSGGVR